ncbi:hypothetical protein THAOC_20214, partial [Thalassiosira oceanica]
MASKHEQHAPIFVGLSRAHPSGHTTPPADKIQDRSLKLFSPGSPDPQASSLSRVAVVAAQARQLIIKMQWCSRSR